MERIDEWNVQVVTTRRTTTESAMSFKDTIRESLSGVVTHAGHGLLYGIRIILLLRTGSIMWKPPTARLKPESQQEFISICIGELINECARTKGDVEIDNFRIYWSVNRSWNGIIQMYAIKIDFQASK